MERASKAEHKLKKICDELRITPEGRKWLDVCVDPFKDIEQRPSGYPDKTMARSVVQVFHSQQEVSRPSTVPIGSNWDCNIFTDTLWRPVAARVTTEDNGLFVKTGQTGTNAQRGGIQIRSGPTGVPLLTEQRTGSISLPLDVFDEESDSRLIAWAFEVHDKTAPLKRQGAVIVYRVSDDTSEPFIANVGNTSTDVTVINTAIKCHTLPEPPTTTAEAIDLPLSQEWKAEDGVYVVPLLNEPVNPPQQLKKLAFLAREGSNNYFPIIQTTTGVVQSIANSNAILPFSLSGAFFNGLSDESVLIVNCTAYIEQFPSKSSQLHRLTQMSCPQDNAAIELYTKIARVMPTGCPVDDNFLGAFIAGIANAARTIVPYIPTIARGIATTTEIIGQTVQAMNGPNRNQSQPSSTNREHRALNELTRAANEIKKDINKKENNNLQIVPYNPPVNRTIVVRNNNNNNAHNNGVRTINTNVKNKRNKNYDRTSQLFYDVKQRDKGNRWVGK